MNAPDVRTLTQKEYAALPLYRKRTVDLGAIDTSLLSPGMMFRIKTSEGGCWTLFTMYGPQQAKAIGYCIRKGPDGLSEGWIEIRQVWERATLPQKLSTKETYEGRPILKIEVFLEE